MKKEMVRHTLELVNSDGDRTTVQIAVSVPYSSQDDMDTSITCWYCPVELKGLRDKVHDIGGDDPFEALVLGIMFVKRMLLAANQAGRRVVFPGTDDDYPIEDIFETETANKPSQPIVGKPGSG